MKFDEEVHLVGPVFFRREAKFIYLLLDEVFFE